MQQTFNAELQKQMITWMTCYRFCLQDVKNLVDLAAIVPYYVTLINVLISWSCSGAKNSASLAFLRVIRLIRVFKLTKHSSGLQVLVLTFRASIEGLGLFLVALVVCILVFSSTIYYVEVGQKNSEIHSIPDAFWWAVITMCTVGYGDKVPKGTLGKIVGSVCALAGVLTLAIPVPIITENFNKFYSHKTGRGRHWRHMRQQQRLTSLAALTFPHEYHMCTRLIETAWKNTFITYSTSSGNFCNNIFSGDVNNLLWQQINS